MHLSTVPKEIKQRIFVLLLCWSSVPSFSLSQLESSSSGFFAAPFCTESDSVALASMGLDTDCITLLGIWASADSRLSGGVNVLLNVRDSVSREVMLI